MLVVCTGSANIGGIVIGGSVWGLLYDFDGGGRGGNGNDDAYRLKDKI